MARYSVTMDIYNKTLEQLKNMPENVHVLRHAFPFNEGECHVMAHVLRISGYPALADKMNDYITQENERAFVQHKALMDAGFTQET